MSRYKVHNLKENSRPGIGLSIGKMPQTKKLEPAIESIALLIMPPQ